MTRRLAHIVLAIGSGSLWALDPHRPLDQYQLETWRVRDGLPAEFVSGVAQDRAGYLWIGTFDGLARFDGHRMLVYNSETAPVLKSPAAGQPVVDRAGVVWFPTRRGLGRIENGRVELWGVAQGLSDEAVRALRLDRNGVLWAGTHVGVDRIVNGRVTPVPGVPRDDVQCLEITGDGAIWVGTNAGLFRVANGVAKAFTMRDGLPGTVVYALREDRDGNLWVGSDRGMAIYRDGVLARVAGLPDTFQRAVYQSRDGAVWVATDDGVYRRRAGIWERLGVEHGLGDKRIRSIFEDREGNIWIATFAGGLSVLKDSVFENYSKMQGLVDDSVWTVFEDSRGRIWAGTNDGVSVFENGLFRTIHRRDGLSDVRIGTIAEDREGAIWIGTAKGLNRWRDGRIEVFSRAQGLPDDNCLTLYRDRNGQLWAGTIAGLARWDGRRFSTLTTRDGLAGNLVRSISETPQGDLLIGTSHGVSVYRDGRFVQTYNMATGLAQNAVMAVRADRAGVIWVSTVAGGLTRIAGGKAFRYLPGHGLPPQTPYQIVEDAEGALWLSHGRGVYRADPADLGRVAEGKQSRANVEAYGPEEGLRADGCNGGSQPAAWAARDGRVWLATSTGIAAIRRPEATPRVSPRSFLETMSAAGQRVSIVPQLKLGPENNKVSFEYTAPVIRGQSKLEFQYRLTGLEDDWVSAGNRREAFYTNLSPGDYGFQVRARSGNQPWGEPSELLRFRLEPWFYQAWWFYSLLGLAAAGLLAALHFVRLRVVRNRYESVIAERERIARELHDSLMQGFIGASLQVQAATRMLATAPDSASERLKRAHVLMNASIREARDAVTDLRSPDAGEKALLDGLERCAKEVAGGIKVTVKKEGTLASCPDSVRWALLRIGREAMANAVRHGNATEVRVAIRCQGKTLQLEVGDDGCGFEVERARGAAEGHWGLAGMRERAEQLGGFLKIDSRPGAGTRLLASIPV